MLQKVLTKVCGKYYDYKDNKLQVVKICVETYESYDAHYWMINTNHVWKISRLILFWIIALECIMLHDAKTVFFY